MCYSLHNTPRIQQDRAKKVWISEHFITMMKLTIAGRLLALNPGIPGAPGAPHPPANTQQIIKQDIQPAMGGAL